MVNRGMSAKSASSIFYEEYNDVDIFIEDTAIGYRKIFKELLNKALGSKFKIDQVFPIGSRKEVIDDCRLNQSSSGRKKVYIVDGDLHILNDESTEPLKGLFVLPRYCVENYLFSEDAITQTAYEEEGDMEILDIKQGLQFDNWLSENENLLLELFIIYAICFKHIPSEQTVGFKVSKLCSSNSGIVCPVKINERKEALKVKLINYFGEERLNIEIDLIKERIKEKDKKVLRYVSGKDYLLPLLITKLQSFLKFPSNSTAIKIRLAMKSDVNELLEIEHFIFE